MKLKTSVFSLFLFASLAFGQEEGGMKHEDPKKPATRANTVGFMISCGSHVEVLAATIENQQIQIATLRKRLSELLFERENLLLSAAVKPQAESYSSSIRKALTAAGADPERCHIEDLISGKITCAASPAAATEQR